MHVRCPHCHNPIELVGDAPVAEIACPSCGSSFSLLTGSTTLPFDAPKRVGRFELVELLGQGAMGAVWKARDPELDRTVAIKIPRQGQLDRPQTEQFLREARAVAQLRHPHIVSVHEVGRHEDTVFIVSDYIRGATLADWLTGKRLTFRETAQLCIRIAEALHHAHEAGVIHRDLKPGNIMVDLEGEPHLVDFGLAKREAGEITMTIDGRLLGTPAYMSPEQARGEAHHAKRETDLYSLGVILFQLLTGDVPFRGNARMLIVQIQQDEPPSPRKLNGATPRDLETITLKCLEKEPTRRYATGAEVAAELGRWLAGEPIHARPVGRMTRSWRWCRRNPVVAGLTGSVAAALLGGAAVSTWFAIDAGKQQRETAKALTNEREAVAKEREAAESAKREARAANARRLAAESAESRQGFPVRSTLLALAAVDATASAGEPVLASAENALRDSLGTLGGIPITSGFEYSVSAVEFSTDGRWLALGSTWDTSARVWDLAADDSKAQPLIFRGHEETIRCLAISPDSRWLVTGSDDSTARIWDLESGDPGAVPMVLLGHEGGIECLAISPNGRWLVTGSSDNTARVWDLETDTPAAEPKVLRGHENTIVDLAISPDGRWLATGSYDKIARVWDLAADDPAAAPKVLPGHTDPISGIAFSPNGRWLATGSVDMTARLWDLESRDPATAPKILLGHEGIITCLAISPDSRWLVTGSFDSTARVWDIAAFDPVASPKILRGHENIIVDLAISPDGRWLATGSEDKTTWIWDLEAWPAVGPKILHGHEGAISDLAMSSGGRWLVTGSLDKFARVWDLAATNSAAELGFLVEHDVTFVAGQGGVPAISQSGRWLATGLGRTARILDLEAMDPSAAPRMLHAPIGPIHCIGISTDGRWLVTGGGDRSARVWDLAADDPAAAPKILLGHEGGIECLAISPDGRWLVTGSHRTARVWDLAAEDPAAAPKILLGHESRISCLAISRDGRWLVTGSDDNTARVWDLAAADPAVVPKILLGHEDAILCLALTHDGRWLATGSEDGTARIWDLTETDPTAEPKILRGHNGFINCVAISSDSRWLVTGSIHDKNARVWDLAATNPATMPKILHGHEGAISDLAMSSGGRWLVTGSNDTTARIWDLTVTNPSAGHRILHGRTGGIHHLAISPDENWLVTSSGDDTLQAWDLRVSKLVDNAKAVVGRGFSDGEREQFQVESPPGVDGAIQRKWLQFLSSCRGDAATRLARRQISLDKSQADAKAAISADTTIPETMRRWAIELITSDWDRLLTAEGRTLVDKLWADLLLKEEVCAAIQADQTHGEALHARALELASGLIEDPFALSHASWQVVSRPGHTALEYALALRQAEAAYRLKPDEGQILNTLGAAQYRSGAYEVALATLLRSHELDAKDLVDIAFLAMTRYRLSQVDDARQLLGRFREPVLLDQWMSESEVKALLAEAQSLIESPTGPDGK